MSMQKKGNVSFGAIVATIGSILIGLGVAWILAENWASIPSGLKIVILVILTGGAYISGILLRINQYPKIGSSLLFLGALLYTLSIFLISQIFSTDLGFQGNANLILLAWVGVFITSYIFDSSSTLIVALVEFLFWVGFQFFAFYELNFFNFNSFSLGVLAIIYLSIGILLYGLTQLHKSSNHKFFEVYRFWTAFYILLLTYILSFQTLLPILWPEGYQIDAGVLVFLIVSVLVSIIVAMVGITRSINRNKLSGREVIGFVSLSLVYILLISLASLVSGERTFFSGGGISAGLLIMWLFSNLFFIFVILSVIGYGVRYKSSLIVYLGLLFFVLDIITRYIGFWLDIGGEIGFAIMSIIGGIVLIFGGWGIEKWRRILVEKIELKEQTGYQVY